MGSITWGKIFNFLFFFNFLGYPLGGEFTAPLISIILLAKSLFDNIPKDIKKNAIEIMTTQSRRIASDYVCNEYVLKRTFLPHNICVLIAEQIMKLLKSELMKSLNG